MERKVYFSCWERDFDKGCPSSYANIINRSLYFIRMIRGKPPVFPYTNLIAITNSPNSPTLHKVVGRPNTLPSKRRASTQIGLQEPLFPIIFLLKNFPH
jgi:hypothetical protein